MFENPIAMADWDEYDEADQSGWEGSLDMTDDDILESKPRPCATPKTPPVISSQNQSLGALHKERLKRQQQQSSLSERNDRPVRVILKTEGRPPVSHVPDDRLRGAHSLIGLVPGWECLYCRRVNLVYSPPSHNRSLSNLPTSDGEQRHCLHCTAERIKLYVCSACTYVHRAELISYGKHGRNSIGPVYDLNWRASPNTLVSVEAGEPFSYASPIPSDSRYVAVQPPQCQMCGSGPLALHLKYFSSMYDYETEHDKYQAAMRQWKTREWNQHKLLLEQFAEAKRIASLPLTEEQILRKIQNTIASGGVPDVGLDHAFIRANRAPTSLLSLACEHDNLPAAQWLLDRGFNIHQKDDQGLRFHERYFPNEVYFYVQARLDEEAIFSPHFHSIMADILQKRYVSDVVQIIAHYVFWRAQPADISDDAEERIKIEMRRHLPPKFNTIKIKREKEKQKNSKP